MTLESRVAPLPLQKTSQEGRSPNLQDFSWGVSLCVLATSQNGWWTYGRNHMGLPVVLDGEGW